MLELKGISKRYNTGGFEQIAMDHISVAFRDNEFVAILGPSGSGKTTMLNVIGGLDRFDSGDLLIDGISTKKFKEKDWDTYRNNRIGFVFQSYNLIPHQSVVSNVELALTLSGVSKAERHERALEALDKVGLKAHANKRPNQLSGGQMQRVAIARALVNDPEILLADEPTGALDSSTSVQVMDLLKEVAKDRLVIMVTHNPELAHQYATRIVELADGQVTADSDSFDVLSAVHREAKPPRKTSMSFLTALGLSFNNLMTKKGRTLMTAFAGSIGIIGIAAILALANGANEYIKKVEEDTLSMYPLTISEQTVNISSFISGSGSSSDSADSQSQDVQSEMTQNQKNAEAAKIENQPAEGAIPTNNRLGMQAASIGSNDLTSLKAFLDKNGGGINSYASAITYGYSVSPFIYLPAGADSTSSDPVQVQPDVTFSKVSPKIPSYSPLASFASTRLFDELPGNPSIYEDRYTVRAGRWPTAWNEAVLVLRPNGTMDDFLEYTLGLRDYAGLRSAVDKIANGESGTLEEPNNTYTYEQLMSPTFKLVMPNQRYVWDSNLGVWTDKSDDQTYMNNLISNAPELHIVGVVQAKDPTTSGALTEGIYYTPQLTQKMISDAAASPIVQDQMNRPDVDVFTGKTFEDEKNGQTSEGLSISSLISIDSSALSSAFNFNPQALNFSSINLSGLDMSSLDLSDVQLPAFDPSQLNLSDSNILSSVTSSLDPATLAAAFPELSAADVQQILSGITVNFKPGGQAAISSLMGNIALGWNSWSAANPGKTMADYLATDQVRTQIASTVASAIDTDDLQQQLVTALANKLGTNPNLPSVQAEVSHRLMSAYQSQIASALSAAITRAMSTYVQSAFTSVMTQVASKMQGQIAGALGTAMQGVLANMSNAMQVDPSILASAFKLNASPSQLAAIASSMMRSTPATYESNLTKMGYADLNKPTSINIYPKDFASKEKIVEILNKYNADAKAAGEESKVVTYTDLVGALMSSVTLIVDMISAMLIAFVSISLVVSSIMIGIITFISVLERKKEIGILRSIGASRRDIANVFNAETFIEGLISGVMGIGITQLLILPANAVVKAMFNVDNLVILPLNGALILILISVVLTLLAGLIPAGRAAKSDPVQALRSE